MKTNPTPPVQPMKERERITRVNMDDTFFEFPVGYYTKIVIRIPEIASDDDLRKAIEFIGMMRKIKGNL